MRQIQLYIHIPFCQEKCSYCDFLSFAPCNQDVGVYVEALIQEIGLYKEYAKDVEVTSVFVGGGTPSVLQGNVIEQIFKVVRTTFFIADGAEISIECNPGTVTKDKLESYRKSGINRISLGLQATNDKELKNLGRIHTYETFLETYHMVREEGFTNVNVDLMSAIPGQTVDSWKDTLRKIIDLKPEHISAYSLIIEEGTKFWNLYGEDMPREDELPSEKEEREMYYTTKDMLASAGYHRYEVSNYSKDGLECRHNLGYWEGVEYLGLGLGASSLVYSSLSEIKEAEDISLYRTSNHREMNEYLEDIKRGKKPIHEKDICTQRMMMEEYMFLGLRKICGISIKGFKLKFGKPLEEVYGVVIEDMIEKALLKRSGDYLKLTEKGIDLSNIVLSEFL